MNLQTFAAILFAVLSSANALYQVIPEGKELIYHYHGTIAAGSHVPNDYASAFALDGKLHVQTDKNSTFMHFSDLKYKMQNGEYDGWHEFQGKEFAMPAEFEPFMKTFKVVHDVDGTGLSIATEAKEPEFIVNMKKAIASMMQMNVEEVKLDNPHPHAFHNDENTLYGLAKINYNVKHEDEHIVVERIEEAHSTQHLYTYGFVNYNIEHCPHPQDEVLTRDSVKTYKIGSKDKVLEEIESQSGIYYHPFRGLSDAHYIWVNQTLNLLTIEDIKTKMALTTPEYHDGFTYNMFDLTDMSASFMDLTHGRRHWNMDDLKTRIMKMMQESIDYTSSDFLTTETPDIAKGQLINRLVRLVAFLDEATMEKIFTESKSVDERMPRVFCSLLSHTGVNNAMHFMKKLIMEKKVTDTLAIDMLKAMSMRAVAPHKKLIEEMDDLMHLGNDHSLSVRKAALYSFATLLENAIRRHKFYNYETIFNGHHHKMEHYTTDLHVNDVYPDEKYYEKYIDEFGKMLNEAKDTPTRLMYLSALGNTHMDRVLKYVMPIVKGYVFADDHQVRFFSLLAVSTIVLKNEDLTHETYWPIMTNEELPLNMRIYSVKIMLAGFPTRQRLINMFWYLNKQENDQMYQYFYSYLQYMSKTMSPCHEDMKLAAQQILRYFLRSEKSGVTNFYHADYLDKDYGFGNSLELSVVHMPDEDETTIAFNMKHFLHGLTSTPYFFLINVKGCKHSIFDSLKIDMKDPTKLFTMEEVSKAYAELKDNKDIQIYISIVKNKHIVMTYYFDHSNINNYMDIFKMFDHDSESRIYRHLDMVTSMVFMPNEMGFPSIFQVYIPSLTMNDISYKKENLNTIITYQIDAKYRKWAHGRHGLSFYNPVMDVLQGVNKYHSHDAKFNFYFDISINPQQQSMKISMKRHEKPEENVMGVRSHVSTLVFVKNDFKDSEFKKSYPDMVTFVPVESEDQHKHKTVFYDYDSANTGLHMYGAAFDNDELYVSNATMNFALQSWKWRSVENAQTKFGHLLMSLMHREALMYTLPKPGSHGFVLRIEPSTVYPVTNIDISLRYNPEYKHGHYFMLPEYKKNIRATYSIKNKEKTVKTWDLNMNMEGNERHTLQSGKMQLSRIIPGQKDFKICMDSVMKRDSEHLDATLTAAFSQSGEAKCTDDEVVFEMKAIGEQSEDQKKNLYMYEECQDNVWSDIAHEKTMACYRAHSSIRSIKYDMKMHNMPTEFKKTIGHWMDWLKSAYAPYYNGNEDHGLKLQDNEMKVYVEYPMIGKVVDVHMHTHDSNHIYRGIPNNMWPLTMAHDSLNLQYSELFTMMHYLGLTKSCYVAHDSYWNMSDIKVKYDVPKEWTLFTGFAEDGKHGIFLKEMAENDDIAFKMVHGDHSIEFIPHNDKHEIHVNGKKMEETEHSEDWFYYNHCTKTNVINFICHHTGTHMIYDGEHVELEVPQMNLPGHGRCFEH